MIPKSLQLFGIMLQALAPLRHCGGAPKGAKSETLAE
jgi:hypothetical protein